MASGNYQMTFSLFRTAVGGTTVWSSGSQTVAVIEGLFSYELGVIVPFPNNLTSDSALWLEVSFDSEIITPRTQFSSVGFALKAQIADTALYVVNNSGWIDNGTTISPLNYSDSVIIGANVHRALLSVSNLNSTENDTSLAVGTHWGVAGKFDVVVGDGDALHAYVASGSGDAINAHSHGSGNALRVEQFGSGDAVNIEKSGTGDAISIQAYSGTSLNILDAGGSDPSIKIQRVSGHTINLGLPDTGLYINTTGYGGYAAILDGNVKIIGNTDFFGPITSEEIWSNGFGSGHGVHAGHDGSGTGKCFHAERAGGVSAFIGGADTGLYINQPTGLAGYFDGVVEVNGNLGVGVSQPDAQLQVKGGNWNPGTTEGDFKVGNSTHRFKIGVAMLGGGAGDVRMRADGGTSRLILGSALNDVLAVNDTRVGIGTLTPNYTLDVRGDIGNNTTLYHSDKRWKKNIHALENSLDKIQQLEGVSFDWRTKEFADMNFPTGTKIGLIAQDVEKILPNIVHTDENGYKSVEYANIVAVLVEAVKEQQKEIEELKRLIKEK